MKKQLLAISTLFVCIFFSSCEKSGTIKEELFHEYFPVDAGHWVIYDVDSIYHDDFTGETDTFYYQVKEVFNSYFIDDSGNEAVRLERFIRYEQDQPWEIKNVWVARLLPMRAEKVEENIRYIKIVFPPKVNKTWDGNAYNIKSEQTHRITRSHEPKTINNMKFDSVATVLQADFETEISKEYKVEKFAKNVGMVYKEFTDLRKDISSEEVVGGVDYRYKIVDYNDMPDY